MKKLIRLAAIIVFAAVFQACSLHNDPMEDGNHRLNQSAHAAAKVYTFRLSLGGDYVEQSEEPLMRADDTKNTYVGINVTCKSKSDADATSENYAYGVFTSKDNISIDLISGYTYDFEATILRDGTDTYYHDSSRYFKPFVLNTEINSTDQRFQYEASSVNSFQYNNMATNSDEEKKWLSELASGVSFVEIPDQPSYVMPPSYSLFPRVDRYYGTLTDIDPANLTSNSNLTIKLQYKSFGLKILVYDLPQNTTLTVRDENDPLTFNSGDCYEYLMFPKDLVFSSDGVTEWEDIYSFDKLKNTSTLNFKLIFTWDRGMGITETFPSEIEIEPNMKKVLQVRITGSANSQLTGNLILETEDDSSSLNQSIQSVSHSGSSD